MTTKKCPKCGSKNFQITDYYIRGYIFEVEEGTVHANGENEDAEHVRTNCFCRKCHHLWHPKKFNYTIDLDT